VPSVLLELGYLSNHADERLLASSDWRRRMADAMLGAVNAYFGQQRDTAATESAAK
jgi:N-acetylmuramoyl-L-alanine amidase